MAAERTSAIEGGLIFSPGLAAAIASTAAEPSSLGHNLPNSSCVAYTSAPVTLPFTTTTYPSASGFLVARPPSSVWNPAAVVLTFGASRVN